MTVFIKMLSMIDCNGLGTHHSTKKHVQDIFLVLPGSQSGKLCSHVCLRAVRYYITFNDSLRRALAMGANTSRVNRNAVISCIGIQKSYHSNALDPP